MVAAVRADHSSIPDLVEEVLRYRPPVVFRDRLTKSPMALGDTSAFPDVAIG
ncbi:hypothetical protein [Amycolatopsis saalfeldensis]|uniref:Uncharacterized protein n=1 Tax=Amycolatopsis saalfeldensis TaxID=394193 RepID=A0A1H8XF69_9PSEU|nr:hypothetical protein [Amycolatopsis saalfeldensis]SEP37908.1 hypothetical protein SAMN04489732_10784 [Amycolatopsis saalfeldensis]